MGIIYLPSLPHPQPLQNIFRLVFFLKFKYMIYIPCLHKLLNSQIMDHQRVFFEAGNYQPKLYAVSNVWNSFSNLQIFFAKAKIFGIFSGYYSCNNRFQQIIQKAAAIWGSGCFKNAIFSHDFMCLLDKKYHLRAARNKYWPISFLQQMY